MIISLTCSKNEGDIIETFVRTNRHLVDLFVFIDDSTDSTKEILTNLASEGFPIRLLAHNAKPEVYRQSNLLTQARRVLLREFEGAIFLPLDCDEFPEYSKIEMFNVLAQLPAGHIPATAWRTYVPISDDFPHGVGLTDGFVLRDNESRVYYKVILPGSLGPDFSIDEGSHHVIAPDGQRLPLVDSRLKLAHFPVRSAVQIVLKNLTAVLKLARTTIKRPDEGLHIYPVFKSLINQNLSLDVVSLKEMGLLYANSNSVQSTVNISATPPFSKHWLKYTRTSDDEFRRFLTSQIVDLITNPLPSDSAKQIEEILRG